MIKERFVEICMLIGNKTHFFHGYIKGEDGNFIYFSDKLDGEMMLNKNKIYYIRGYRNLVEKASQEAKKFTENIEKLIKKK